MKPDEGYKLFPVRAADCKRLRVDVLANDAAAWESLERLRVHFPAEELEGFKDAKGGSLPSVYPCLVTPNPKNNKALTIADPYYPAHE